MNYFFIFIIGFGIGVLCCSFILGIIADHIIEEIENQNISLKNVEKQWEGIDRYLDG